MTDDVGTADAELLIEPPADDAPVRRPPIAEPDTGVRHFGLRPFGRLRLATQLAILSAAVIAVVIAGSFAVLETRLRTRTRTHLTRELARTQQMLLQLERRELARLLRTALLVGEAPTMRAAIETYRVDGRGALAAAAGRPRDARNTLQRSVDEQFQSLDADLVVVTDARGRALAAGGQPADRQAGIALAGDSLGTVAAVRHALDPAAEIDSGNVGVVRLGNAYYTVAAAPIVVDGLTIGTVVLGDRIDLAWLRNMQASFGGEFVARAGRLMLGSTLPDASGELLPSGTVATLGDSARAMRLAADDWVAAPLTLGVAQTGEPVTLWMLHSVGRSVREITRAFARDILVFGILAVLLAGVGAAFAARAVLAPLTRIVALLRDGARTGVFHRAATPGNAPREIRVLGDSYVALAVALDGEREAVRHRTAELETANADLTQQVRERVRVERALHEREEQLRQSQKLEALGTLAGGVAHDFNNLLTVISGFTQLALGTVPKAERVHDDLLQVKDAAHRAGELTAQLLAFGRRQVLRPRVVDVNDSVTRIHAMLDRLVGKHLTLQVKPAAGLARVHADPGQLEQVLMNLAINARDAMPDGGTLTIATASVHAGDDRHAPITGVALTVRDTGTGMDAATKARIFEPFFTTKEVGKGTGLGLATVYGIVQQSGGTIAVESAPGKGTTFTVVLPAVAASDEIDGVVNDVVPRGVEVILLVEDEPLVRRLAGRILTGLGYHVIEAAEGAEALTAAERFPGVIDLLLTDVVMPRMTGREVARRLRLARPETRVLFMSGHSAEAVALHGDIGPGSGSAFMRKPFAPEMLARQVREILDVAVLDAVG